MYDTLKLYFVTTLTFYINIITKLKNKQNLSKTLTLEFVEFYLDGGKFGETEVNAKKENNKLPLKIWHLDLFYRDKSKLKATMTSIKANPCFTFFVGFFLSHSREFI